MAKQLQLRRGTTVQNDAFTGALGELTMDTDTKQLRLHDGATLGGCGLIDLVVAFQRPTAENNYTWFRKYASGWVEQGGKFSTPQSTGDTQVGVNVALPVTMANNLYDFYSSGAVIIDNGGTGGGWAGFYKNPSSSTTTTLVISGWRTQTVSGSIFSWEVKGMAA